MLITLEVMVSFEKEQIGDNILCTPSLTEMETALELLLEAWLNRCYKTKMVVIPRLISFLWIRHMGKEAGILFTITVLMPFW